MAIHYISPHWAVFSKVFPFPEQVTLGVGRVLLHTRRSTSAPSGCISQQAESRALHEDLLLLGAAKDGRVRLVLPSRACSDGLRAKCASSRSVPDAELRAPRRPLRGDGLRHARPADHVGGRSRGTDDSLFPFQIRAVEVHPRRTCGGFLVRATRWSPLHRLHLTWGHEREPYSVEVAHFYQSKDALELELEEVCGVLVRSCSSAA